MKSLRTAMAAAVGLAGASFIVPESAEAQTRDFQCKVTCTSGGKGGSKTIALGAGGSGSSACATFAKETVKQCKGANALVTMGTVCSVIKGGQSKRGKWNGRECKV